MKVLSQVSLPRSPSPEEVVVVQKHPDVVENLVELSGRGMEDEIRGYANLSKNHPFKYINCSFMGVSFKLMYFTWNSFL